MSTVDEEWENYIAKSNGTFLPPSTTKSLFAESTPCLNDEVAPECSPLLISTESKMSYLSAPIPLDTFWNISIIPYDTMCEGVVKKQIKYESTSAKMFKEVEERLDQEREKLNTYVEVDNIKHVDTLQRSCRARYSSVQKISIGVDRKNVMDVQKKAQMVNNSFTMIVRVLADNDYDFCEIHVKVFNTGKLEMPGVQNNIVFNRVLALAISVLQTPEMPELKYTEKPATILINSNFSCGYKVDRDSLYRLLIKKYKLKTTYDQWYPGVRCQYEYQRSEFEKDGVPLAVATKEKDRMNETSKVTFVVFRTGSVLIMGLCTEVVLRHIYEFLRTLFREEYMHIRMRQDDNNEPITTRKRKPAPKTRIILVRN